MKVLVLNSGSSSQKSSLYEIGETVADDPPAFLWEGKIEWHGDIAEAEVKNSRGTVQRSSVQVLSRAEAVEHLLSTLWQDKTRAVASAAEIDVVGHRVVHGGPNYDAPVLVTPEVKAEIAKAAHFAPLHNRAELDGMELVEKLLGPVPQVAVFDTAGGNRLSGPVSMVRKRHSSLRVPRCQSSILRGACRAASAPRSRLAQSSYLPSRERLLAGRNSREPQH